MCDNPYTDRMDEMSKTPPEQKTTQEDEAKSYERPSS